MADDDRLDFTGDGFSKEPMTPEELAKQRERNRHYDQNFLPADKFLRASGLEWVSKISKGFPAFAKAFIFIGTLAGAYLAITKAGWW